MKTRFDEAGILGPEIFQDIVLAEAPVEVQEQVLQPAEEVIPETKKKEKKRVSGFQIAAVSVCVLVTMVWLIIWLQTNQIVPMLFFVGNLLLAVISFFGTLLRATQS